MTVARVDAATLHAWHAMRLLLWPGEQLPDADEAAALLQNRNLLVLIALERDAGIGFAEASVRHDYVNGCETSPVLFLEGIYVRPEHRKLGVARTLCDRIATWGREQGCTEFASDALIENLDSHAMHAALGFAETERVVYFRKVL